MNIDNKQYAALTKKLSPPSTVFKDCIWAFTVGGLICVFGQLMTQLYSAAGLSLEDAKLISTVSLVFLSAFATACKFYDNIAKHAGAGTLVPITGFANSIVSPAMEFKTEGFVTGVGVKMFSIAGPVLVYGISASVLYGLILWIAGLF